MERVIREDKNGRTDITNPLDKWIADYNQLRKEFMEKYKEGDEMSMEDTMRYRVLLQNGSSIYGIGAPAEKGTIQSYLNLFHDNGDGTINMNGRRVIAGRKIYDRKVPMKGFELVTADDLAKLNEQLK